MGASNRAHATRRNDEHEPFPQHQVNVNGDFSVDPRATEYLLKLLHALTATMRDKDNVLSCLGQASTEISARAACAENGYSPDPSLLDIKSTCRQRAWMRAKRQVLEKP